MEYKRRDNRVVMDVCTLDSFNIYRIYLQPSRSMDKEHPKIDFSGDLIRGPETCDLVLTEASDQ
jgi:hypothetical protein